MHGCGDLDAYNLEAMMRPFLALDMESLVGLLGVVLELRDDVHWIPLGRDEAVIREYIRNQEREDKRLEPMDMWR